MPPNWNQRADWPQWSPGQWPKKKGHGKGPRTENQQTKKNGDQNVVRAYDADGGGASSTSGLSLVAGATQQDGMQEFFREFMAMSKEMGQPIPDRLKGLIPSNDREEIKEQQRRLNKLRNLRNKIEAKERSIQEDESQWEKWLKDIKESIVNQKQQHEEKQTRLAAELAQLKKEETELKNNQEEENEMPEEEETDPEAMVDGLLKNGLEMKNVRSGKEAKQRETELLETMRQDMEQQYIQRLQEEKNKLQQDLHVFMQKTLAMQSNGTPQVIDLAKQDRDHGCGSSTRRKSSWPSGTGSWTSRTTWSEECFDTFWCSKKSKGNHYLTKSPIALWPGANDGSGTSSCCSEGATEGTEKERRTERYWPAIVGDEDRGSQCIGPRRSSGSYEDWRMALLLAGLVLWYIMQILVFPYGKDATTKARCIPCLKICARRFRRSRKSNGGSFSYRKLKNLWFAYLLLQHDVHLFGIASAQLFHAVSVTQPLHYGDYEDVGISLMQFQGLTYDPQAQVQMLPRSVAHLGDDMVRHHFLQWESTTTSVWRKKGHQFRCASEYLFDTTHSVTGWYGWCTPDPQVKKFRGEATTLVTDISRRRERRDVVLDIQMRKGTPVEIELDVKVLRVTTSLTRSSFVAQLRGHFEGVLDFIFYKGKIWPEGSTVEIVASHCDTFVLMTHAEDENRGTNASTYENEDDNEVCQNDASQSFKNQ